MYKLFIKFLSAFIRDKEERRLFRKKYLILKVPFRPFQKYEIRGTNNEVILIRDGVEVPFRGRGTFPWLNLQIIGNNNRVVLAVPKNKNSAFKILLHGNDNLISVAPSPYILCFFMGLDKACYGRRISIGENCSMEGVNMIIKEDNATLTFGRNCMLSYGITMRTDGHTITDAEGRVLNHQSSIILGNDVWVGQNVFFMKNVTIPDGCIVAACSVMTKRFTQQNAVLGGYPAKIVKEDIRWNRQNASDYFRKQTEKQKLT